MSEQKIEVGSIVIIFVDGEDMMGEVVKISRATATVKLDSGTELKAKVKELHIATARDIAIYRPSPDPEFVPYDIGSRVVVTGDKGECLTGSILAWSGLMYQIDMGGDIIWHKSPEDVELLDPTNGEMTTKERLELEAKDNEKGPKTSMAKALSEARKTYRTVKKDKKTTADCGDAVAVALSDLSPVEVANLADIICEAPAGHHAMAYSKLNPGQMRMNSGNKIRARYNRAVKEGDLVKVNLIRGKLGLGEMGHAS